MPNPYAPPTSALVAPGPGGDQGYGVWREGLDLVVPRQGGHLPNRCVLCNERAVLRQRKRFSWHSPWLYLLLFVSPLLYVIVALIARKQATLELPLCDAHRKRRKWGILVGWLGSLAGFALIFVAMALDVGWVGLLGVLGLLGSLITGVVLTQIGTVKKIDKTHVRLRLSPAFLDSIPAQPPPAIGPPLMGSAPTGRALPPAGWGQPPR